MVFGFLYIADEDAADTIFDQCAGARRTRHPGYLLEEQGKKSLCIRFFVDAAAHRPFRREMAIV